jgi:hypothetical protein
VGHSCHWLIYFFLASSILSIPPGSTPIAIPPLRPSAAARAPTRCGCGGAREPVLRPRAGGRGARELELRPSAGASTRWSRSSSLTGGGVVAARRRRVCRGRPLRDGAAHGWAAQRSRKGPARPATRRHGGVQIELEICESSSSLSSRGRGRPNRGPGPANLSPVGGIELEVRSRTRARAQATTMGGGSFGRSQRRHARGGTGKQEATPLGGGRGEPANYRVGAPLSTSRRRGRRGAFGRPAKVRGGVGGLLECVFFLSAPTS